MKSRNESLSIKTGNLLIAEPFMLDPHFKRAVVLLADHHQDEGTVGFILNRKTGFKLNELTEDFGEFEADVYYGGPVDNNSVYFIHTAGNILDNSLEICPGIYWSGDYDKLKILIECKLITSESIRFYIGYSGWTAGQLEEEMNDPSWILTDMDPNYLYKSNPEQLWKEILDQMGYHFSAIGRLEGDELMN